MKLLTMIVDDERLAREKLRALLSRHEDVELVGECADGDEALREIPRLLPDLVFLDVRMPSHSGFEVAKRLRLRAFDHMPHVVFVTAHGDHAIEAFEVEAVDYLLKPFDRQRLDRAVERVRRRIGEESGALHRLGDLVSRLEGALPGPAAAATPLARVAVKRDGRTLLIPTQDIEWIEAVDKYVRLHTKSARYLHREALSALERSLDPVQFLRIHRGTIVNLQRVREIQPGVGDEPTVVLTDGTRLALSRRYRARLRERGIAF